MSDQAPQYGVGTMLNCRVGCIRRGAHAAPLDCDVPSERRMPAWPMTEDEPVDPSERARKAHEEALGRMFPKSPRPDPTKPPPHYKAKHRANGIEPGSERIDWIAATRGREAAISYLVVELGTKADRLCRDGRTHDQNIDDLFKIEQATAKLRQLMEQGE